MLAVSPGEFYVNIDECQRLQPSRGAGTVSFHVSFPLTYVDHGEDGSGAAKGDKSRK